MVGNWGGDSVNSIQSQLINNDSYKELLRTIIDLKPKVNFKSHMRDLDSFQSKCYAALRNSYIVGSDGLIYKCTEGFDMPENQIGYLNEDGEMIIDHAKHMKWLDLDCNSANHMCNGCSYWGCCLDGPCPKAKIESAQHSRGFCPRTRRSIHEFLLLFDSSHYQQF